MSQRWCTYLGAAEDLARAGADLPLEEIAEGLLDDVPHLGEVALADAADLDERRAALRVETGDDRRLPS